MIALVMTRIPSVKELPPPSSLLLTPPHTASQSHATVALRNGGYAGRRHGCLIILLRRVSNSAVIRIYQLFSTCTFRSALITRRLYSVCIGNSGTFPGI